MPTTQTFIDIAGKRFRFIGASTIHQNCYAAEAIRLCGLDKVEAEPGENPQALARRVWIRAASSGHCFELLGAIWIPADMDSASWTVEIAAETGRFFGSATGEDKRTIREALQDALSSFFAATTAEWGPPQSSTAPRTPTAWLASCGTA